MSLVIGIDSGSLGLSPDIGLRRSFCPRFDLNVRAELYRLRFRFDLAWLLRRDHSSRKKRPGQPISSRVLRSSITRDKEKERENNLSQTSGWQTSGKRESVPDARM